MDQGLAKFFFDTVTAAFSFVTEDLGLSMPKLEIDDSIHFAFVTYMGKACALELSLDEKEEYMACQLVLVLNGTKAEYYPQHINGKAVREHLIDRLERAGKPGPFVRKVGGLDVRAQIMSLTQDYSRLMKMYGKELFASM